MYLQIHISPKIKKLVLALKDKFDITIDITPKIKQLLFGMKDGGKQQIRRKALSGSSLVPTAAARRRFCLQLLP